jgi:hypothetical protein
VTEYSGPSMPEPSGAPRTSRARAIVVVVLGLSAMGVLTGVLWAWIAPPAHAVVALTSTGKRVHDYLGTESQNFFIAPSLMLGLLSLVAVVATVVVWQWREQRGPGMVVALTLGLMSAATAAAAVGAPLVLLHYGALNFDAVPLSPDHKLAYVIEAPPVFFAHGPLQVAVTLMWPVATAAVVSAVLACASARDDLEASVP